MDKIDKQIMEILIQNCRISHSTIAKTLKLSKDTISNRIKKLKKENNYTKDLLFIDPRIFGYTRYQILIQLESGIKNKKEIFEKISSFPNAIWINTFIGLYDLQIIVDAKNISQLNEMKKKIYNICNNKIKKFSTIGTIYEIEFTQLNPDFNFNTKFEKKNDHSFSKELSTKNFPYKEKFEIYKPSKIDLKILKILSENPQESLLNISSKLNIDRKTVKKKISNLIEKKVIISFGAIPNLTKLGYVTYTLLIRLSPETPENTLKKPFLELNNIFYAARFYGEYDMLLYLNAKTPEELNNTIEKFKITIGDYIIHQDLTIMDKVLAWNHYTPHLHKELMKKLE